MQNLKHQAPRPVWTPESPSHATLSQTTPPATLIRFLISRVGQPTTCHELASHTKIASLLAGRLRKKLDLPRKPAHTLQLQGRPLKHDHTLAQAGLQPFQTLTVVEPMLQGGASTTKEYNEDKDVRARINPESFGLSPKDVEESKGKPTNYFNNATDEQKWRLKKRLSKTDFYLGLDLKTRERVEGIICYEQIDKINRIDLALGYQINFDDDEGYQNFYQTQILQTDKNQQTKDRRPSSNNENQLLDNESNDDESESYGSEDLVGNVTYAPKDPKKYKWIFAAYNMASRKTRLKVFESILNEKQDLVNYAAEYLHKLFKVENFTKIKFKENEVDDKEAMNQTMTLAKQWASEHWLRIDKSHDFEIVKALLESSQKDLLIPLPTGMRILPIIQHLEWQQKMRILYECMGCKLSCSTFLDAMVQSCEDVPAESMACEALQSMYPIIDDECFRTMVKKFEDLKRNDKVKPSLSDEEESQKPKNYYQEEQKEQEVPKVVRTFLEERFNGIVARIMDLEPDINNNDVEQRQIETVKQPMMSVVKEMVVSMAATASREAIFLKFWNNLLPCLRKKFARKIFKNVTKEMYEKDDQEETYDFNNADFKKAYKVYKVLDLDSQAELHALVGVGSRWSSKQKNGSDEPEDIDIMDKFLELAGAMIVKRVKKAEISKSDPNSPSKETDKPEQVFEDTRPAAHLRSESLHHRFFHLRQPFQFEDKQDQKEVHQTPEKRYTQIEKDMREAWKYIPFDVAGDYLQTIPLHSENKDTYRFIAVQPFCHKNLDNVFQTGKVQNSDKHDLENEEKHKKNLQQQESFHRQKTLEKKKANANRQNASFWRKNCDIEMTEDAKQDTLHDDKMYSIVSFWEFDAANTKTYICFKSFTCPTIVPCIGPSEKRHRKRYILQGEQNEIFFFCHSDDNDSKDLYLCQINLEDENMQNKSRRFIETDKNKPQNVKRTEIKEGSELYKFLIPDSDEDVKLCRRNEIRFHQIAPTLVDAGEVAGKFLFFSFSRLKSMGPTLHMFSLKEKKVVLKIQSAELFIDFIKNKASRIQSASKGQLYFSSDSKHFVQGSSLCDASSITSEALKLQDSMIVRMKIDFQDYLGLKRKDNDPFVIECKETKEVVQETKQERTEISFNKEKQGAKILHTCFRPQVVSQDDTEKTKNKENLDKVFSRYQHRIVEIEPIKRDERTGELKQFCVTTVQHLKKDRQIYIIDLEGGNTDNTSQNAKTSTLKFKTQIAGGPFSTSFIVVNDENQNETNEFEIQTVKEDDLIQTIQLHDPANEKVKWTKKMQIPNGQVYLAQQMLTTKNSELLGCFLDKQEFAVHWFHETTNQDDVLPGSNYQTESCEPLYTVEYPLICFTGPFPDRGEIRIVNLADKKATRISLELENMQIESFVQHRSWSDTTKICFIVQDFTKNATSIDKVDRNKRKQRRDRVSFVTLNCERMMQKKLASDLSYFTLTKEWLGDMSDDPTFRSMMSKAVKVEAVHDLLKEQDDIVQCFVIQSKDTMYLYTNNGKPQEDVSSSTLIPLTYKHAMQQVRFKRGQNNKFYYVEHSQQNDVDLIKELKVKALENIAGFTYTDKIVHQLPSGQVIALEEDIQDQAIDQSLLSDGSFGDRTVMNKLFFIDDSYQLMRIQQNEDDTDTYSVSHHTDLAELQSLSQVLRDIAIDPFSRISVTERCITIGHKTVNLRNDYSWSLSLNTIHDKEALKNHEWEAYDTRTIDNTYQQLMVVRRRLNNEDDGLEKSMTSLYEKYENAFIVKPLPGSRKICLVGSKGIKAIEMIEFISDDLMLIKMFGNYWTCIDTFGQIQWIDPKLYEILHSRNVVQMTSQRIHEKNQVLLMLFARHYITSVVFDHRGRICEKIKTSERFVIDELESEEFTESSATFLRSDAGKFYRVSNFTSMGKQEQEEDMYKYKSIEGIIRINFITKTSLNTTFIACGDYLCWHHPERSNGCIIYYAKFDEFESAITKKEISNESNQLISGKGKLIQNKILSCQQWLFFALCDRRKT